LFSPEVHQRMEGMCEATGFTPGLIKSVISPALAPGQPVPMRKLARDWHCDPSYVTMQVRELEQRGLAERHFNPEDHRFKTVLLTEKGRQVRSELLDRLLEPPAFFGVLSAAEQRDLRALLDKLVAGMQSGHEDPAEEERSTG
jgi:DNA-binding MarR family transcriptional regulator